MKRRVAVSLKSAADSSAGLVVGFALAIAMMGVGARHWHVSVEFYATVAQVIPVLLLAAAVEGRMFRSRRNHTRFQARAMRGSLLLVGIGEASALAVVARGHDSALLRIGSMAGIVVVVAAFIVFTLDGPALPDDSARDSSNAAA